MAVLRSDNVVCGCWGRVVGRNKSTKWYHNVANHEERARGMIYMSERCGQRLNRRADEMVRTSAL